MSAPLPPSCGCRIVSGCPPGKEIAPGVVAAPAVLVYRIEYCPLHSAARDMLAALKGVALSAFEGNIGRDFADDAESRALDIVKAVISKAEGRTLPLVIGTDAYGRLELWQESSGAYRWYRPYREDNGYAGTNVIGDTLREAIDKAIEKFGVSGLTLKATERLLKETESR